MIFNPLLWSYVSILVSFDVFVTFRQFEIIILVCSRYFHSYPRLFFQISQHGLPLRDMEEGLQDQANLHVTQKLVVRGSHDENDEKNSDSLVHQQS